MAQDRTSPSDIIAGTGPSIPDDALVPGEALLTPPTDEQAAAKALGAPVPMPV